jgi:site-specific recombinase XerD
VKRAKGDIERIIPIPDAVLTELLAHLLERGVRRGHLFVTEARRRPVRQRLVVRVVREAAERAAIAKEVTPKTLRHSFATHLMDRGVDVATISRLMGHAGPAESGVYLHILPGRQRSGLDKLD